METALPALFNLYPCFPRLSFSVSRTDHGQQTTTSWECQQSLYSSCSSRLLQHKSSLTATTPQIFRHHYYTQRLDRVDCILDRLHCTRGSQRRSRSSFLLSSSSGLSRIILTVQSTPILASRYTFTGLDCKDVELQLCSWNFQRSSA